MKRLLTTAAAIIAIMAGICQASEEGKTWPASDNAKQFVKDTIIVEFYAPPFGVGWDDPAQMHTYMERAIDAGITAVSITLAPTYFTWDQFLAEYNIWRNTMLQKSDNFIFVHDVEDIERAHREKKYAIIWNNQTSSMIDGDLSKIAIARAMGLSSMMLVYNGTYRAGDGGIEAYWGRDRGLTPWGRQVLDEMVKQGVVVDLSHIGLKTTDDIIDYMNEKHPGVPVIYTHSVPAGLYKNEPNATERGCYRNISDEQAIKAAKTGGLVAPTFTEWMMDGIWPDDITPKQGADMLDYLAKLIGVDHVGLASDDMFILSLVAKFAEENPESYDDEGYMLSAFAKGANGCGEMAKILPAVTDELWKRGYSNEDIAKIYGGNMMRIYKQVWK